MSHSFVEDVSMADIAFNAENRSLSGLFKDCANAVTEIMIKNTKSISCKIKKRFVISTDTLEKLLFEFINEIIFYKDSENLIFNRYNIKINKGVSFTLQCEACGEKMNTLKHKYIVDAKAATMHMLNIKKRGKTWRTTVVIDI